MLLLVTKKIQPLCKLNISLFTLLVKIIFYFPIHSFGQQIWLEPECGSPGANWTVGSDPAASGETYLTYELNETFSTPPTSGDDQLRISFKVVQAGTYKVWARTKAPQAAGDSFWFRMNNEAWIKWKNIKKGDTFQWGQVQDSENDNELISINLTTGEHLITIGYREKNVQLDKLFLSADNTTPSGAGGLDVNCGTDGSIWMEAECATVGDNLEVIDNELASQSQAILMSGNPQLAAPSNDLTDRLTIEVELTESGNYHLSGRLSTQNEKANSLWIKANNENWIKWDPIAQASGIQANVVTTNSATEVPIIPGYASFAMDSKGGRGGKLIKVTNLKDSGTGSLRACVEASGARTCVFETSGVITLKSELKIDNPYITIAGQTAPDPGILLYGETLIIKTHDVLVQHLGVRPGDINYGIDSENGTKDCIAIRKGADKVVLDHLSLAWGSDENLGVNGNVGEICLRNVLFSNALNAKGHAFGALLYDQGSLAIEGSMFANLDQRQPMSRIGELILVNNLHYNRGLRFAQFSTMASTGNKTLNSIVGNVYVEGPSRRSEVKPLLLHKGDIKSGTKMYLKDNYWKSNINSSGSLSNQWSLIEDQGGNIDPKVDKPAVWVSGMKVLTEEQQIVEYVLQQVGPRPTRRNYLDQKIIDDYKAGKGGIVDCVSGCSNHDGGLPKLAENQRTLTLPSNHTGDDDGDGYTNLEEWLHQMAAEVEGKPYEPGEEPGEEEPGLSDAFTWHKLTDADKGGQAVSFPLQAGKNIIEIARRESGLILDKLHLSKTSSIPSGLGGNAYNCSTGAEDFTYLRINAGGTAYNASGNKTFIEDTYFSLPSSTVITNSDIAETQDIGLYQSERTGSSFSYNIPLENGTYDIRLRFAELNWLEIGKRRFDVIVEGATLIKELDIFANNGFGVAVDKELLGISVQDGSLDIDFQALAGEAQLCAIEVLPAGSLSNSSNTPPSFTISGDLLLTQDFEGIKQVEVFPDPVSIEESAEVVTYSLSPAYSLIANIDIDPASGRVQVKALEGVSGSEEFTIIANDGQEKNNLYSQSFKLIILSDEPTSIDKGGSTIRINAGGSDFTNSAGLEFKADKYYLGNSSEFSVSREIAGTTDDPLYQSERWGYEFSYQIPVINGEYNVVLHFSEVYWKEAGKRLFDISVEGEEYFSAYDIYQQYGEHSVGVEVLSGIMVVDGVLNLDFLSRKHMAKISAIEVITTYNPGLVSLDSRESVRINCGENQEKAFGGYIFQPDMWYVSSNTNSLLNDKIGISATNFDAIYRSARSSQLSGEGFGYNIPVENGKYIVYLHFAEIYWGVPGGATGGEGNRVFSISMEDVFIEETYDILSKTSPGSAFVERIEVEVTDGFLEMEMVGITGKPIIGAIEILTPSDEETSIGVQNYLDQQGPAFKEDIFSEVSLFPNPAVSSTKLMINSEVEGDFKLSIMDMQGRTLLSQRMRKTAQIAKYLLPVADLPAGMYVIRLTSSLKHTRALRLVKPE